jgi:signal transduction histidine kinase
VAQYSSDNGLPQNTVNDLLMDNNHFLWIATHKGLVRWDGQRFKVYNTSNTPAIKSNRFPLISETIRGKIYFPTDFDDSSIYRVTDDYRIALDSGYTRIKRKLITYHSNGIFDYDRLVAAVRKRAHAPNELSLLDRLFKPEAFWIFDEQEAVLAEGRNYYYVNGKEGVVGRIEDRCLPKSRPKGFAIGHVFCIAHNDGTVHCYEENHRIGIRSGAGINLLLKGFSGLNSCKFSIFSKGGQTLLRKGNDFYRLVIQEATLRAIRIFANLTCMQNQPVTAMVYDSLSDMLLLGTSNAGLWVIRRRIFQTLIFPSNDRNDNELMAFQVLSHGRILTGNGILDSRSAKNSRLFDIPRRMDGICIFRDNKGFIWCSKHRRIWRYEPDLSRGTLKDTGQLESYMTGMAVDSGNLLWLATSSSLFRIEDGKIRPVVVKYGAFKDHPIESIASISAQQLWLATRNGLYEYDKLNGKINPRPILPDTYVRCIFHARDGSIWIGSYGRGFFKYVGGVFYRMPLDADRYLEEAHAFLEDKKGYLWISTNHGLFRAREDDLDRVITDKESRPFLYYCDKSYGFATNEFNGGCNPAAAFDSSGNFYFPSMAGMVYFLPDSCPIELPDRPIFVDEFNVDSVELDPHKFSKIESGFRRILVQVSTPFYGASENVQLEFGLGSGRWYPVSRDGTILLNQLPSGEYHLQIRKLNGWGMANFTTLDIPFEVTPYWYNAPWIWIAAWVGVLTLVVKLRTRILKRQNLKLQIKVDERTHELEESAIAKEQLLSVIMHDLRSPLQAQNFIIQNLYKDFRKLNPDDTQRLLLELAESGKNIQQFSADFLVWYDSQKHDFAVKKTFLKVQPLLETITTIFQQISIHLGIRLTYAVEPGLQVFTDEHLLAIVVRNIVDNAIKHTESGTIGISAFKADRKVHIRVEDTGRGMHPDMVRQLMEPAKVFGRAGTKSGQNYGYRFIREFTGWLDASLEIESRLGTGTVVTLILPA